MRGPTKVHHLGGRARGRRCSQASVVVVEQPRDADRRLVEARHQRDGLFDPLPSCVVAFCRARGCPALSSDPTRRRRLDNSLEIDLL